ncbi:hypothetical protein SLA2020_446660 [Shorea laevis]
MKSSYIIFLCLLTAVFYMFSLIISISSSSSSLSLIPERRPMRKLGMLVPHDKHKCHKMKVDEEKKGSTVQEGSKALTRTSSGENLDHELVYHTDYHGVTTHPTPTPRHPKP